MRRLRGGGVNLGGGPPGGGDVFGDIVGGVEGAAHAHNLSLDLPARAKESGVVAIFLVDNLDDANVVVREGSRADQAADLHTAGRGNA